MVVYTCTEIVWGVHIVILLYRGMDSHSGYGIGIVSRMVLSN